MLFVFDPRRTAILLVGGDKSEGDVWNDWYEGAIEKADHPYDRYLAELRAEGEIE